MTKSLNQWGQTHDWEEACIETRRDPKERQRRLKVFRIKKTDKVLDLGCGDGLNIKLLRRNGVKKIVGLDISPALIAHAKKINPGVKFVIASAEKLPFRDRVFDVVLVDSVFHHFMRYSKALKEIKRVIVSGGKLCFIEPHGSILRQIFDFVSTSPLARLIPPLARRGKSYLGEEKFMKHWLSTEGEFYRELDRIGFIEKLKKTDLLSIVGIYEMP